MLIKFDSGEPAVAKNGNQFLRGIVATGDLGGSRCIVWEEDPLFDMLPGNLVEVLADVRDYVAVQDSSGTTYESWVLADLDVQKTLSGEEAAAARSLITAAQISAMKNRGPRRVGATGVAGAAAAAGVADVTTEDLFKADA